jgi:hypothetical protein
MYTKSFAFKRLGKSKILRKHVSKIQFFPFHLINHFANLILPLNGAYRIGKSGKCKNGMKRN